MRKAIMICTFLTGAAFATGSASVVSSFRTPCTNGTYGIDYHGGYLYHADGPMGWIYRTTTAGSVLSSIRNLTQATGIDRTDGEFWTCNYTPTVYRLSTTGSIIRYFNPPGSRGYGITFGGGFLWYSGFVSPDNYVYKFTVDGSIVSSFKAPFAGAAGICWDAPYLWLATYGTRRILQLTQTGSVVESFAIDQRATGVTWDGEYVWYAAENWIYRVRYCFTTTTLASLGKVKALYR